MPVEVPKEPKKLTTIYDNFKGVDYTNDASNSYRRRSPSGKNMLPDLDGVPHKRPGWEIVVNTNDYLTAFNAPAYSSTSTYDVGDYVKYSNSTYKCTTAITVAEEFNTDHWSRVTSIDPLRTHYFNYGGKDYMMIFNSLGVFYIKEGDSTVTVCQLWDETLTTPAAVPFPQKVQRKIDNVDTYVVVPADHNRAFFFEGNGLAGFYVFVENTLFRFGEGDDGGMYFFRVEPTIPTIITGAQPTTGAGTNLDPVNMLTNFRTVEYFGDGQGVYKLPSSIRAKADVSVSVLNTTTGQWEDIPSANPEDPSDVYWDISDNTDTLTFFTGHVPERYDEGNVRITYAPGDGTSYALTTNVETNRAQITDTSVKTYVQRRATQVWYRYNYNTGRWEYDRTDVQEYDWEQTGYSWQGSSAQLDTHDIFDTESFILYSNHTGSFQPVVFNEPSDEEGPAIDISNLTDLASAMASTGSAVALNSYGPSKEWGAYNSTVTCAMNDEGIVANYGTDSVSTGGWYWVDGSNDNQWGYDTKFSVTVEERRKTVTRRKTYTLYGTYTSATARSTDVALKESRDAFAQCRKVLNFGNNIYNQVFLASTPGKNYRNRVWYSAANDPSYFPDTNFIEVGADDKSIMGLQKVGSYLGIIKMGSGTEASVYLAYPTSFDEESTYAVKQSVSGIGAISTGAFNILNEEPLFLSENGVMGINITEDEPDKQIRNRSYFVNKKLTAEPNLNNAISFVFDGLYYLAVNNRCYVLDGAQKSSWANEKTNLQYECYCLDNIPAQCFAKMGGNLYFTDNGGNLCRFKKRSDEYAYVDDRKVSGRYDWITIIGPTNGKISWDSLTGRPEGEMPKVNQTVYYPLGAVYTIISVDEEEEEVYVESGVPIEAQWDTIADDDGMVHFFKNLTKKGCVVSFMPDSNGVDVYLKADEKEPVYIGTMPTTTVQLPSEGYVRKKIKKYKRLQIICKNDRYNEGFAIDQIIKTYTVGNYSKNRG